MNTMTLTESPHKISSRIPFRLRIALSVLSLLIRTLFRVRVVGAEKIPEGNYIVLANHLGWIDPLLLMIALPAEPRLYFIGAQQAFQKSWKVRLMRAFDGMIPFARGSHWLGKDVLKKPLQVLQSGAVLAFFPEGNSFACEGELQPLQRGIGHFLMHADYGILPVGLSGTHELYWRKLITITVGEPFHVTRQGLSQRAAIDSAVLEATRALQAVIPPYTEPVVARKHLRFLTTLLD